MFTKKNCNCTFPTRPPKGEWVDGINAFSNYHMYQAGRLARCWENPAPPQPIEYGVTFSVAFYSGSRIGCKVRNLILDSCWQRKSWKKKRIFHCSFPFGKINFKLCTLSLFHAGACWILFAPRAHRVVFVQGIHSEHLRFVHKSMHITLVEQKRSSNFIIKFKLFRRLQTSSSSRCRCSRVHICLA